MRNSPSNGDARGGNAGFGVTGAHHEERRAFEVDAGASRSNARGRRGAEPW
jgi:hypothetical protein